MLSCTSESKCNMNWFIFTFQEARATYAGLIKKKKKKKIKVRKKIRKREDNKQQIMSIREAITNDPLKHKEDQSVADGRFKNTQ